MLNASPAPAPAQSEFTSQFSMPLGVPSMMGIGNMSAQLSPQIQTNQFAFGLNQVQQQPRPAPIPPPAAAPKDVFDDLFN